MTTHPMQAHFSWQIRALAWSVAVLQGATTRQYTSLGLNGLFFAVRLKVPDVDVREPFASWLELPRRDSLTGDTEVIRLEPLPYEVPP